MEFQPLTTCLKRPSIIETQDKYLCSTLITSSVVPLETVQAASIIAVSRWLFIQISFVRTWNHRRVHFACYWLAKLTIMMPQCQVASAAGDVEYQVENGKRNFVYHDHDLNFNELKLLDELRNRWTSSCRNCSKHICLSKTAILVENLANSDGETFHQLNEVSQPWVQVMFF